MGEESISRPPASKNAAMTEALSSRSFWSRPTLKVIQVPSPTIGKGSPVDGTGFVAGAAPCACAPSGSSTAADAEASMPCRIVRRVAIMRCSVVMRTCSRSCKYGRATIHEPQTRIRTLRPPPIRLGAIEQREPHWENLLGRDPAVAVLLDQDELLRIGEPGRDHHPAAGLQLMD